MSNSDVRFGLRPVRHRNGAPYNGAGNPYSVPSGYGTALYVGDPVVITSTANTAEVSAPGAGTFPPGAIQEINKATVGANPVTGVIIGFAADPSVGLDKAYNPASTARIAFVEDDPDVVFEIQADGTVAATQIGLNAALIYTHSGSTVTNMSGAELDTGTATSPATTASLQLKIHGIDNSVDNELATANPRLLVTINNHTNGNVVAGV